MWMFPAAFVKKLTVCFYVHIFKYREVNGSIRKCGDDCKDGTELARLKAPLLRYYYSLSDLTIIYGVPPTMYNACTRCRRYSKDKVHPLKELKRIGGIPLIHSRLSNTHGSLDTWLHLLSGSGGKVTWHKPFFFFFLLDWGERASLYFPAVISQHTWLYQRWWRPVPSFFLGASCPWISF